MMQDIDLIRSTSMLSKSDFEFLASVSSEMMDTMEKRQMFRTATEMEVSVLNDIKHPTPASKYWQSVREQAVMFENLITLSFEYRRNEIQIKRLLSKIEGCANEFDRDDAQVDLDECHYKRASMESVAKDRIREIKMWSEKKAELDDGSFDTRDVNTHQLESYAKRFILQASNAPENMPVAEANNLKGQIVSSVRKLKESGRLDSVIKDLPRRAVSGVLGMA